VPEQLIVFSDTQITLDLIARTFIEPGDLVVVENPGYTYARELFEAYGAETHAVRVDENGLVVEELEALKRRCKFVYTTPAHNDTTGAVMSMARRKALLAWARENCDYIVEDAFDSDYFYANAPLPTLPTLDERGKTLYMYNFWKLLFPLTAIGFLIVPLELVPTFTQTKQHLNRYFSAIEQQGLTDTWNGTGSEQERFTRNEGRL
jgi:GntR family transcriptional regulator/MocR family aminotransferase